MIQVVFLETFAKHLKLLVCPPSQEETSLDIKMKSIYVKNV